LPLSRVHIGFFRDFKSADTVLIDGDSRGLHLHADALRGIAADGRPTAIHELPFVEIHHGIRIFARRTEHDAGESISGVDVTWRRSASGWEEAAERVEILASVTAGHQYLDALDGVCVMASIGEYGEQWWIENG